MDTGCTEGWTKGWTSRRSSSCCLPDNELGWTDRGRAGGRVWTGPCHVPQRHMSFMTLSAIKEARPGSPQNVFWMYLNSGNGEFCIAGSLLWCIMKDTDETARANVNGQTEQQNFKTDRLADLSGDADEQRPSVNEERSTSQSGSSSTMLTTSTMP